MKIFSFLSLASFLILSSANAAFMVQVDTDGSDDGPFTPSPNFSFGGDTTTASSSSASTAVGLPDGDSLFGGNGSLVDTYVYTYTPSADADNLSLTSGTALNGSGDVATGIAGGSTATYKVFGTWPFGNNVSGGLTNFELTDGGGTVFSVAIDQTGGGAGTGNEWILLGTATLTDTTTYTLTQSSTAATFVSMRASAVMFEAIPEPSTSAVIALSALGIFLRRRR